MLDLGADEDFMIGAGPASQSRRSTPPSMGAGARAPPRGALLFAVGTDDFDDDAGLATDEELPLAPSPHRYGYNGAAAAVRGYGTAG